MKRLLSIIVTILAFACVANAQITIKKTIDKPERLTTLSPAWSWVYKHVNSYYLVMKSDNQFDDDFWLKIGDTKEECLESLASLIELAQTIEKSDNFDIESGRGEDILYVSKYGDFGASGLLFHAEGYAGRGYILLSNLNKAEKWIQKNLE